MSPHTLSLFPLRSRSRSQHALFLVRTLIRPQSSSNQRCSHWCDKRCGMDQSSERERARCVCDGSESHKWARSGLRRAWARGNVVHAAGRVGGGGGARREARGRAVRGARCAGMPAAAMPHRPAAHAGSGSGSSKPWTHGKNLSPGLRGEQHCEKSGALSEPSIMQKGVRL